MTLRKIVVLAALLAPPFLAHAQTTDVPSDATSRDADDMNRRAMELLKARRFLEAEDLLRRAIAIKPAYDIVGNLGVAEVGLERWRDAAEHLAYVLANFPANGKEAQRVYAEEKLVIARQHIGSVRVRCDANGAEVLVDGVVVGTTPLKRELFLEPGSHVLQARLDGRPRTKVDVRVDAGTTLPTTPLPLTEDDSAGEGGPSRGTRIALAVTSGVLAIGGFAIGAALTAAANGKSSDAAALTQNRSLSTCTGASTSLCQTLASDVNSQSSLARGSVAGYVVGGAFAATAVGLGVWASRGSNTSVQVGVRGLGVELGGSW